METSTPSATLPLEIDSLVKRFGNVTAVDHISLNLTVGECLGLLGPNGAGKSTLIRSIVGRVIPDSGSVAVFGSAAGSAEARDRIRIYARPTGTESETLNCIRASERRARPEHLAGAACHLGAGRIGTPGHAAHAR